MLWIHSMPRQAQDSSRRSNNQLCLTSSSGQLNNVPSHWFSLLSFSETELPETLVALQLSSVQLLSGVRFFASPWTAAHQASLFITNSWSLLKFMSIELVMPFQPLLSPSPDFDLSQHEGLLQSVSSLHQVAKVLEFHLHHQSFQGIFRTDFL